MSSEISPEAASKRAGPPLPTVVRAAVYGVAWVPFVGLVTFFVPRFDDLFAKLTERGELPALTACLLWFSRLNAALFCLPCLLLFALLVVADVGVAGWSRRWRPAQSLYWVWFVAVILVGILAAVLAMVAPLLGVLKMGATI